ncbi:hypothetical protein LTR85_012196 [Meristemomyces frigidus]|nr:hypothetical protein LTR85_012196 [Meristemomyces frigidus]
MSRTAGLHLLAGSGLGLDVSTVGANVGNVMKQSRHARAVKRVERHANGVRGQSFHIVDVTPEIIRDYFDESADAERVHEIQSHGQAGSSATIAPVDDHHDVEDQTMAAPFTTAPATPSSTGETMLQADNLTFLSPQLSDSIFDDGIFLPGSQYQELHAQLRSRIIDTARSTVPSRLGTPDLASPPPHNAGQTIVETPNDDEESRRLAQLSPEQEYVLWQAYINEVSTWLDKFDNDRHFELVLPMLAKTNAHLKYSILALSARQIERKEQKLDYSCSLALYQHAIHLLSPLLQRRTTDVLASCVVLCVLEMLSCSPKAWRRHLDGCAALIQALGISGASGGLEQALFWVFSRMDVCGGLISSEKTLIPMHKWLPQDLSGGADLAVFQMVGSFDMYANHVVWLCGRVVDLLCSYGKWEQRHHRRSNVLDVVDYTNDWQQLFEVVQSWYQHRPDEMKALISIPSNGQDPSKPFPTIFFANGPATSGNQMYHTAALLMLKYKPARFTKTMKSPQHKSMLWHARCICAISISNAYHGCWTNSTQPLWIAGQQMSHPSEHKAILEIYERIERETGWATKWRADDLREFWGDLNT